MRFRRAQFVTVCQQSLVTGVVLAVAASAAGVRTLDIVPTPGRSAESAGSFTPGEADLLRERALQATVETAPVKPKVREFEVDPLASEQRAARSAPPVEPEPEQTRDAVPAPSEDLSAPVDTADLTAVSEPAQVRGYATVGVTWSEQGRAYGDDDIRIEIRTETDDTWSGWSSAEYHDEHGPDGAEAQRAAERAGTDAVVVGDVDRVQMRARTLDGSTPQGLTLAVIDPGLGETDDAAPAIDTAGLAPVGPATGGAREKPAPVETAAGADDTVALNAMRVAPRPKVFSRAQWGANEKLRGSRPSYGSVQTGFIHHTVNANSYTQAQVPALLRGIYAYHTQSRGWSDIGYNVLVDRFGRIWEGRYGGLERAVVGAHTLGYNEVSFAMSAIGNFDTAAAPQAVLNAYSAFFAWKLSLAGIKANTSRISVKGRTFQAINGHRDAGSTACPGRYLYAKLPTIRTAAAKIQNGASPAPTPTPTPPPPPAATFSSPTQTPQPWASQPAGVQFPAGRDLVGSAHPDLVVKRDDGVVQVVPTGGQVGFTPKTRTGGKVWRTLDLVVAVGDVTGDGKGDVLGRVRGSKVTRVWPGDGKGKVSTRYVGSTSAFATARSITAAGDWTGDRINDLLVVDAKGALRVWRGRGNGTFIKGRLLSSDWSAYKATVVTGDLTGDARPDVLGLTTTDRLRVLPVTSTGTLGPVSAERNVGAQFASIAAAPGTAGDLTGDGVGDVLLTFASSKVGTILPGASGGGLGERIGPFTSISRLDRVSMGQMAASGQGDLVGVDRVTGDLVVVRHNGLTNVAPVVTTNVRVPDATQVLGVGDWDRDGHGDIVTREADDDRLVLRTGNGSGSFAAGVTLSNGWRTIGRIAAVGDVTGDKFPDLAGVTAAGAVVIYPGDGDDGFLAPRKAPPMLTFNVIGAGKWSPGAARSRYHGTDGSFVPATGSLGHDPDGYNWVIGPGDVNGDGRHDVVMRATHGGLWLFPGTSTGLGDRRYLGLSLPGYDVAG